MSKIYAKTGAALIALTVGFAAISVGPAGEATASASSCGDFLAILDYYLSSGDFDTAEALITNLYNAGCF